MTLENSGDGSSWLHNGAWRNLSFGQRLLRVFGLIAMACFVLPCLLSSFGGVAEVIAASSSGSVKALNINIVRVGGWNVWWFIAFWMLSQCIIVHHARRGSKQQG